MHNIILYTEYVGIASAALSGFYFAARNDADLFGIFIAMFLTSLGGGLVRDMIVSRPAFAFTNYMPISIVLIVLIIAVLFRLQRKNDWENKFLFITTDAIDIVCFAIVGADIAIEHENNIYGALMIGFINGAGGGMFRDITFAKMPWFLNSGFYGTVCIVVSLIYFILDCLKLNNIYTFIILMIFGIAFRLVAYYKNWHLPKLKKY